MLFKSQYPRAYKFIKLGIIYVAVKLLIIISDWVGQLPLFNIVSLEEVIVSDATFNDLYYQVRDRWDKSPTLSGQVILVNTGGLPADSFRLSLAQLMTQLHGYEPAAIAVDHDFYPDTSLPGSSALLAAANLPTVIMAQQGDKHPGLPYAATVTTGDVQFPEGQSSIRRYTATNNSFAYRVAEYLMDRQPAPLPEESFVINYLTDANGFFTPADLMFDFYLANPEQRQSQFLMLDGQAILQGDDPSLSALSVLAKDRVFLLGHMGNPVLRDMAFDIEDKHRVPCDTNFVNRSRTMDGLLIHANAVENIIQPAQRFTVWSDSIWFSIVVELFMLAFLYYLLYVEIEFAINMAVLITLSFPALFLIIYLMTQHIYIEFGLTLLQILILEELVDLLQSGYRSLSKVVKR